MLCLKLKGVIIFSLDYWSHVMPTAQGIGAWLHRARSCLLPQRSWTFVAPGMGRKVALKEKSKEKACAKVSSLKAAWITMQIALWFTAVGFPWCGLFTLQKSTRVGGSQPCQWQHRGRQSTISIEILNKVQSEGTDWLFQSPLCQT